MAPTSSGRYATIWKKTLVWARRTIGEAINGHIRITVHGDKMGMIAVGQLYIAFVTEWIKHPAHDDGEENEADDEENPA